VTSTVLYLRPADIAAAIKHGAVTDCQIYSVDDRHVELVPVQLMEREGADVVPLTNGASVDLGARWTLPT